MVDLFIVVAYLAVTLFIGIYTSQKIKTMRDYAIGDRQYPTVALVATLFATRKGGGSSLGMAERVFTQGITYIFVCFGFAIADLIAMRYIAPHVGRFHGMISVGDIMHSFYGKIGRVITGVAGTIKCLGAVGAQVAAVGYLFNFFLDIPHVYGALIGCGIVVLYSTLGGVRAVTTTDIVQFGVLLIAIPVICNMGLNLVGGYKALYLSLPTDQVTLFPESLGVFQQIFLFFIFCFPFLDPAIMQRLLMTSDADQAVKMMRTSASMQVPFFVISGTIGLVALAVAPTIDPGLALPHLVKNVLPIGIKGLAIAGMLAVIMSTADSYLNASSIAIVHDIIKPLRKAPLSDKQELRMTRVTTLLIGVGSIFIALSFKSILDIVLAFLNFWVPVVLIPLIAGIVGVQADKRSFLLSVAAGLGTFAVWKVFGLTKIVGVDSLAPSMAANALAFFGSYWYIWPVEEKRVAEESHRPMTAAQARRAEILAKITKEAALPGDTKKSARRKLSLFQRMVNFSYDRVDEYGAQYTLFGIFAVANYIIPYFMWSDITPDNYNTFLTLRVLGGIMCVLLIIQAHWPASLKPYLPFYWHCTLIFCLSFLTTYMLLESHAAWGWLLNTVLTIFLLAILVDWASFFILLAVGIALGVLLFLMQGGAFHTMNLTDETQFWALYMFAFATFIGLLFSRNKEHFARERVHTLKALSGAIAHEMRTPLASIGHSIGTLETYLPSLMSAYEKMRVQDTSLPVIEARYWKSLQTAPMRLRDTSRKAQNVIDMLLMKLREDTQGGALERCSIEACIQQALALYPFNDRDKELVTYESGKDFTFQGNQEMTVHVLFNLIKNALYQIKASNRGEITIYLKEEIAENTLHFRDTGPGISALRVPFIFERFYTKTKHGTGIGLAFCKKVMADFEGSIRCTSVEGSYTEFILGFPTPTAQKKTT